jgi:glycosyltransferase involved in cell wall biosynthesis
MADLDTIHVCALVDSLGVGGAEMLVPDFAAVCGSVRVNLSVGYLTDKFGSPAAARLRRLGIEPALIPCSGLGPSVVRRVRHYLMRTAPDLVHTHLGYADLIGGVAARSLGLPTVSTIHATEWDEGSLRDWTKTRLFARARRHCAARVLAVSESAREAYLDTGWDVAARVRTVRSAISRVPRPGTGPAIRAELGLEPEHLVVTMLSALRTEKGHALALETVRQLIGRWPQVRLVIVGDGPIADEVARMAVPLGAAVVHAGYRDDVMELLDASDVLLHPSRTEAFPTALLEAMAAGVPIVATAVGGVPEIVDHGRTGVLVEPPPRADRFVAALVPLLADEAARRRLGAAGRRRFETEFSAPQWAARLREHYDEVLAMHRRGRAA